MKKKTSLSLLVLLISATSLLAQTKSSDKIELPADVSIINAQLDVFKSNVYNHIQVTDLDVEKFDKISVTNKQGFVLIKKTVNTHHKYGYKPVGRRCVPLGTLVFNKHERKNYKVYYQAINKK